MRNKPWAIDFLNEHAHIVDTEGKYTKNISDFFDKDQPIHLEVGTGMGTFITTLAERHPEINFVGVEIAKDVLIRVLEKVLEKNLTNVRLLLFDATTLTDYFNPSEIDRVYLNFSDPWPKNRHAKRRLTHENFLGQYEAILKEDGDLQFKTDNRGLFEFSLISMNQYGMDFNEINLDVHRNEPEDNIRTEYENKFSALGNKIYLINANFKSVDSI